MPKRIYFKCPKIPGILFEFPSDCVEVIIGRSSECDYAIADRRISRHHCILRRYDSGETTELGEQEKLLTVTDKSMNGTYVNTKKIPSNEEFVLNHGDILAIGSQTNLLVQIIEE